MALLACIPVTGCLTLAEVAACSLTTADQTFKLENSSKFILEDSAGVDIFVIDEAGLTLRMLRGLTPPNLEVLNPAGFIVGLKASEPAGSVGFYMQNSEDDGYAEMLFVNENGEFEDVMSAGIGNTASDAPYTNRGYFYTADNLDGLLFQAGAAGATIRFDAGGFDNEVMRLDDNATAGNTRLMIYDVDNGQMERVSVGAAGSGGAGFKVLRIPN